MSIFTQEEATFIRRLPETKRITLIGLLFQYVFRGNRQEDIRDVLQKRDIPFDLLSWRLALHRNGDLLRDGKAWIYALYSGRDPEASAYDLTRADRVFIDYALQYKPLRGRLRTLRRDEGRPSWSPARLDAFVTTVLHSPDLLGYARRFIHHKMGFLVKSYGQTFGGIESDLMTWALYGLLRAYPRFDDVGHGIAIAKTTLKRRGINFIKAKTTQGKNELILKPDGKYERTTVSLSSITDGTGQFLSADGTYIHRSLLVVGMDGLNSSRGAVDWESMHALNELLKSRMLNAHHRRFLSLMLGKHDEEFSQFLGVDNDEYIEKTDYHRYRANVCAFMGLTESRVSSFLESLKPHLGGAFH